MDDGRGMFLMLVRQFAQLRGHGDAKWLLSVMSRETLLFKSSVGSE